MKVRKESLLLILLLIFGTLVGILFWDISSFDVNRNANHKISVDETAGDEPLDLYKKISSVNSNMDKITISTTLDSSKKNLINYIDNQAIVYEGGLSEDVITLEGIVEVNAPNYDDNLSDNAYSFSVDDNTIYQRMNGDNPWNITKDEFKECFKDALLRGCLFEAQLSKGIADKVIIFY